jgi:two-component system response regulator AlgR
MKIVIADDDPVARERLIHLIKESSDHTIVGEAATGLEAIGLVTDKNPDLVLMDIDMPDLSGVNAASHLKRCSPDISIIFVTAYEEHAVRAFELEAVDYVMKPVTRERLTEALGRVVERYVASGSGSYSARGSQLCVRRKGEMLLLELKDIVFLKAQSGEISVRCNDSDFLMDGTLKGFEETFPNRFLRIHRKALVAPDHIAGLSRDDDGQWMVSFREDPTKIEVSRRHLPEVRRWMKQRAMDN